MNIRIPAQLYRVLSTSLTPGEVVSFAQFHELPGGEELERSEMAELLGKLVMAGILDVTPGAQFARWAVVADVFSANPAAQSALVLDPKTEADRAVQQARMLKFRAALADSRLRPALLARTAGIPEAMVYAWSYGNRAKSLTMDRYDRVMRAIAILNGAEAETQTKPGPGRPQTPAEMRWQGNAKRPFLQAILRRQMDHSHADDATD